MSLSGNWHSSSKLQICQKNYFTCKILTGYYMGYTLIWVLSMSDTCHITNEWAQRTSEWYDMCHELIKSISKCNPCYNLFITYHIKGLWGCINALEMSLYIGRFIKFYDRLVLRYARQVQYIVYVIRLRVRCFLNILCCWYMIINTNVFQETDYCL